MDEIVQVNFHCHSNFSDGDQAPEVLAGNLASAGVRYAALTDHDTIDGLPRFQDALRKRGIAFLSGVELTTQFNGREAHILGYGFDPDHTGLASTLLSLRQVRGLEVHSIAGSIRKAGSIRQNETNLPHSVSAAPHGYLEIEEAIALIHRSGGYAFWAHPLIFEPDLEKIDRLVEELKSKGLDGIEAIYAPFSETEQAALHSLAQKHHLLVCAGTDFHSGNGIGGQSYSIGMPREDWNSFREAVFSSHSVSKTHVAVGRTTSTAHVSHGNPGGQSHHFRRRSFVLRIFLPTFLAIALFLAAIWGFFMPSIEQTLLDRKREMIRELTNSAWSILASYQLDEQNGLLSREQAQAMAITRIEALRYGDEGKDYFWIQDMQPRMIMHPYRADLNGQDLRNFTDPRGVPIFVEFASLVQRSGEGYIDYVWQWKDDPQRLEPKESFVKGFSPWGWVIGTGIYIDDVNQEIARIEQRLINTSLAISGAIVLLLFFVLQQSLRIEQKRQEVVDNLRESTERYHTLVEATTEGTLLVLDDRCRYANPIFLSMLGYTARQLEFLELVDILPRHAHNEAIWERLQSSNGELSVTGGALEGSLLRADGIRLECILNINPIQFAEQHGFILLARDIARQPSSISHEGLALAAQSSPFGIFRAKAARQGIFLEINPIGLSFLPQSSVAESAQPALADFFTDPTEYDQVLQTLLTQGEIKDHILHIETSNAEARFISLSAILVRDEQNHPDYISGLLEDVTAARKHEIGREALIEKLQSSLLFLHEPIANLGREIVVCKMDTSIEQLSRIMTSHQVTAALVSNETSTIIGIVTDHDLRARVLAESVKLNAPIHTIMSAPLTKISEHALIYEALLRMEEKGVRHLAVEDQNGQIVSVIDSKSLIQFQRYGPIVLSREIGRAKTPDEVAQFCERNVPLVKSLLDSSARPRHVTNMLASICDAATERLIHLAIDDLGPPHVPFAFIAMGSQGRQEQTLLTDQDNGIIFASPADTELESVTDYFLRLGTRVCDGLNRAGFAFCRGNVMASNPHWCRSLPSWIAGFNEWVNKTEPQELMDLSIFFDFRTVYGETELTHELRRHIHSVLHDQPAFFHLFAQNALTFKPPFRLLGNIYFSGGAEHSGEINLKDAMMPMVSFARLYSLQHQINQTHTLERIEALTERNLILSSSRDEITASYDFLMQLRLQNQIAAIQAGRPPGNTIHPSKLGYIQQELLKQAFAQIAAVQKKVSYDFLGGT
ncbi:MAG: cache domain-containing protein [Anaerolineaceae bacterium]|nr:cache domain-containing protein [Anaerolineaceae bacterium]